MYPKEILLSVEIIMNCYLHSENDIETGVRDNVRAFFEDDSRYNILRYKSSCLNDAAKNQMRKILSLRYSDRDKYRKRMSVVINTPPDPRQFLIATEVKNTEGDVVSLLTLDVQVTNRSVNDISLNIKSRTVDRTVQQSPKGIMLSDDYSKHSKNKSYSSLSDTIDALNDFLKEVWMQSSSLRAFGSEIEETYDVSIKNTSQDVDKTDIEAILYEYEFAIEGFNKELCSRENDKSVEIFDLKSYFWICTSLVLDIDDDDGQYFISEIYLKDNKNDMWIINYDFEFYDFFTNEVFREETLLDLCFVLFESFDLF